MSVSDFVFTQFLFSWAKDGAVEPRQLQPVAYDRLVVFGSSYSDNEHPDDNPYESATDNDENRLWVDYLHKELGPNNPGLEQLNFARKGARVEQKPNNITSQIDRYKTDYDDDPSKKEIVALFTTTNDIMWNWGVYQDSYKASCTTYCTTPEGAHADIRQTVAKFLTALDTLVPEDRTKKAPDFLIFPIVPVELTPISIYEALSAGTDTKAIKEMAATYNAELKHGARILKQRLGDRGDVFVYDIEGWFHDMHDNPATYGLDPKAVDISCPKGNNRDSLVCERYIWRDENHLLPHLQRNVSEIAARLIRGDIPK